MGCHPSHWLSYFSRLLLHHQAVYLLAHIFSNNSHLGVGQCPISERDTISGEFSWGKSIPAGVGCCEIIPPMLVVMFTLGPCQAHPCLTLGLGFSGGCFLCWEGMQDGMLSWVTQMAIRKSIASPVSFFLFWPRLGLFHCRWVWLYSYQTATDDPMHRAASKIFFLISNNLRITLW